MSFVQNMTSRLRVRRLGSGRKGFGGSVVRLEPDVAYLKEIANASYATSYSTTSRIRVGR